jgi:serine/threonine protein phosphatase PrpC
MYHSIHLTASIRQLSKGQDMIVMGKTIYGGQEIDFACVMDGHGTDACITALRAITSDQWQEFMAIEDPISAIQQYLSDSRVVPNTAGRTSGATCCLVRRFDSHLEVLNVGDSQCLVFLNDEVLFMSDEHNCFNEKEKIRLKEQGRLYMYESSKDLCVIGPQQMIGVDSKYALFKNGVRLACTQALGHNNTTGIFPDRKIIPYSPSDTLRVVLGSDGLFDMCQKIVPEYLKSEFVFSTKSDGYAEEKDTTDRSPGTYRNYILSDLLPMQVLRCEDICQRAVDRWHQVWEMSSKGWKSTCAFTSKEQFDDVAVCVMDIVTKEQFVNDE